MLSRRSRSVLWNDETGRARAIWRISVPVVAVVLINVVATTALEDVLPLPAEAFVGIGVTAAATLVIVHSSGRFLDAGRVVADYGLAIDREWLRDLFAGFGIGFVGVSIPFLVGIAAGWFEIAAVFDRGVLPLWTGVVLMVFANLGTGLWEELLFRGVLLTNAAEGLQGWLSPRHAVAGGVAISALVFGLGHAGQPDDPLFLLTWILAGAILGTLYVLSGSLALTIGVHVTFNVAYQAVFVRTDVMAEELSAITRIDIASVSPLFEFGGVVEFAAWLSVLGLGILWLLNSRGTLAVSVPRRRVEPKS